MSGARLNDCSIELSDLLPILGIDFDDFVKNWASFNWAQINSSPTRAQNCLLVESKEAIFLQFDLDILSSPAQI